jgi:hypothetical protein
MPQQSLGLRILYEPPDSQNASKVNIIFIHGLGGTAIGTWTHPVSNGFWPMWLPEAELLKNARIATFGYESGFANIFARQTVLGISEFADQLLEELESLYHEHGDVIPLFILPLIVGTHDFCSP